MISSPSNYGDVQQKLIAEIHRNSTWPVVVSVDGKTSRTEKSDYIDRDGSYIILTLDGNIKNIKAEILGLILDRKKEFKKLWNSETRFVVAGANEFSSSQQKVIFDYLSKFTMYNCIIVSQEHDVIDKEYSRPTKDIKLGKGMKLGVYTWFPYHSSERCTEVNDITLLDSWVNSAQGHFTKNTDLFPRKISNNLNRCPMKSLVFDGQWAYSVTYVNITYSKGSVVSSIVGLDIDLLSIVLQQMNMTFLYVPNPEGTGTAKNRVNNLVRSMFLKEYYIILGSVGNYFSLNSIFSSTNPYYIMTLRWYVPCFVKYPRWSSIFRILSVELWLVVIISIVIAAISTTLVGRYSCTSEWQSYKTVTRSLTNIWAVILGVSVSTMPRAPSLRSLFLTWVCFSMAFNTVFQAFLTSFLVDSGYKIRIQNLDELLDSGIKFAYSQNYNMFLETRGGTESLNIQRNHVKCPSFGVCFAWAKYHTNVSVLLPDKIVEEFYAIGGLVGENSEPFLCRLEDGVFHSYGNSMIMFHGDPLMTRVNEIIDRVVEAGLYSFWNSLRLNWMKIYSRKIAIVHPFDEYYSFNLYHMQPAFYLIFIGWCLSAFCFMVEVLYNRLLSKRNLL